MATPSPRFIVGTGCSGSALLARMLGRNRHVLAIDGFWSILDRASVFADGVFNGEEVVALANRSNIINDLIVSRATADEIANAAGFRMEINGRVARAPRMPALRIFVDPYARMPDRLYDEVLAYLKSRRARPLAEHWRALFNWLARRHGRRVWVEWSSVSIEHVGKLADWYPNARFVHVHRDGPRNALGLGAFPHFRLYASFFSDPPDEREIARALTATPGEGEDPILRRMTRDKPTPVQFGQYWSWQVARGVHDLMRLPARQRLDLRYEDLVAQPRAALTEVADFLAIPDDRGWLERAALEIDPEGIPDRVAVLEPAVRAALEQACLPGQAMLGQLGRAVLEDTMVRFRHVATMIGA